MMKLQKISRKREIKCNYNVFVTVAPALYSITHDQTMITLNAFNQLYRKK